VILVTGAAHRVGASIVRLLHKQGFSLVLHYRQSATAAKAVADELNNIRPNTVDLLQADLQDATRYQSVIKEVIDRHGRLDVLVNNASSFYPTKIGEVTLDQWNDLMDSNLKAPFFLSQSAASYLRDTQGCIINIVDIHADRPLKEHPVYCMAKAGLVMMTKSLAKELGPEIRVNAVAPGAILWPSEIEETVKDEIISRTALKRKGAPEDIAKTVSFLINGSDYITGQVIPVDGGRSLNL